MQQMLKCINFANKVHVEITEEFIKFAADQSRVTQGSSNMVVNSRENGPLTVGF